ncbi:hypothetical protein CPC08DRAFT_713327 [Agrocybe pediades]|nr:hypothetical protein CPC08DRAFT_713327 [Agrocybe pediades]
MWASFAIVQGSPFASSGTGNAQSNTIEWLSDDNKGLLLQLFADGGVVELRLDEMVGRARRVLETRLLQVSARVLTGL